MKRITKQIPVDFIEFDDGTLIEQNEFIRELMSAGSHGYTRFNMDDSADINKYNFIKAHCNDYNPIKFESMLNNRELEVAWIQCMKTHDFFFNLVDIVKQI